SSRRRHTRCLSDWSSDVCSSDLIANGFPREDGFDITVASEVMAIFCLAKDLEDLKQRLSKIVIGYTRDRKPVRAGDIKGHGPMRSEERRVGKGWGGGGARASIRM